MQGLIGKPKFRPNRLAGLVLWLRADAGVTRGTGMAAQCTAASSQALTKASNASLQVNGTDFTFAGWVYFDSNGTVQPIVCKGLVLGSNSQLEYTLYRYSDNALYWDVTDGTSVVGVSAGAISSGAWHFLVASFDTATKKATIQVDNGAASLSGALASTVRSAASALYLGRDDGTSYLNGRLAGWGFWKRLLTAAELTTLYNAGVGLGYADVWANGLTVSLVSAWDLTEPSGTRYDSFGSNDLTASASSPTTNPGVLNNAVTTWADQSGSGNDASQATQANKPHAASDSLGRLRVRFNANDYLSANTLAASFSGVSLPFTVYAVGSTTGGFGALCGAGRSSSGTPGQEMTLNPAMTMYRRVDGAGGGFTALSGATPATGALAVLRYSFDGATATITLNGGSVQTDPAYPTGAMTVDRFAIGAFERTSVADYLTGDIAELVVYNRDLSANERAMVRAYLGRRALVGVS